MGLADFFAERLNRVIILKEFFTAYFATLVIRKNYLESYAVSGSLTIILTALKLLSCFRFRTLVDIAVVDLLQSVFRFKISYNLLSPTAERLIINAFVKELDFCNSVAKTFAPANWLEREA